MEEGGGMSFQLAQASFRAVVGTLAAVATVLLPVFAWQAERFVTSVELTESKLVTIQQDVAVLSVKMEALKENLTDLKTNKTATTSPAVFDKDI